MILASAALSVLAATVQLYFSYQSDFSRVMSEIDIVESSFLSGLENALWPFNFAQVETLVEGIYAQTDIVRVRLLAETGQVFERGEEDVPPGALVQHFELSHAQPNGVELIVGHLEVVLSLEDIRSRLWGQLLTLAASNFVKTMAASIFMIWIFDRMVSRHLRQVTDYVSDVNWTSNSEPLVLQKSATKIEDDLNRVVFAINESRRHLSETRRIAAGLGQKMEAVLNAATSGIVALDQNGRITMLNPMAQHMLGIEVRDNPIAWPKEISFLDYEHLTPLSPEQNPIKRLLSGQGFSTDIVVISRRNHDHDPRYVRLSGAELDDPEQSEVRYVVIIDDVSEQERRRQQTERASRLEALGQLTGGVAHDFNNLLATISYGMDLAKRSDNPAERSRYIDAAMSSVERGAALTKRLLAFAKRQPGQAASRPVNAILDEFEALARPTLEEVIDFRIERSAEDLTVFCDVGQLENALLNLVINARDAILRSGKGSFIAIRVRALASMDGDPLLGAATPAASTVLAEGDVQTGPDRKRTSVVEFSVTDDGPGMDPEVRRRALDPFFTTKDTHSGTGLGLSMAYGFAQQSDGQLKIYSEREYGTTVRLLLPRGQRNHEATVETEADELIADGGETILIVEDEAELEAVMRDVVTSFGYHVLTAPDGTKALGILETNEKIDCVLTDVVMPGKIDGFELARLARGLRPDIPILYMSGYTGFSREQMGQVIAPILAKPTPPEELAVAIQAAIEGSGTL